jgi:Asp-tRNA(Asn)/Glu-tRNA(Gln) amidotransferase A subunit family amidase
MGFSKKEKMPLSLQIIGKPWEEAEVLGAAYAYEEATPDLRTQHPKL